MAAPRKWIWGDSRLGYSIQRRDNPAFPYRIEVWVAGQAILVFDADDKKEALAYARKRKEHFYGKKSIEEVRKAIGIK